MLFGENKEFGLMQEGFGLKVVKLGENGVTEKDILIHDDTSRDQDNIASIETGFDGRSRLPDCTRCNP